MHMKDIDNADEDLKAAWRQLIDHTPIEERLRGLTPEQCLAGLTPEQILKGLTPEQLAAILPPEVLELLVARKARAAP